MISRLSLGLAGWLLVLAVIFAPWAYGCTRPLCILILTIICYSSALFWLLGRLLGWSLPRAPFPLVLCVFALLLQGWWMTWNAQSMYDRSYNQFAYLVAPVPDLPGSVDQSLSKDAMTTLTSLLLACLVAADLGRKKSFRQKILTAMILTGFSLSLFGLWIILSRSHILWWPYGTSPFMFATFRYHANAGSYLNLVWPLSMAAALCIFSRSESKWLRLLGILSTITLVIAVAVNASKGAQGVAAGVFFLAGLLFVIFRNKLFPDLSYKILAAAISVFLTILISFSFLIGTKHAEARWNNFLEKEGESLRSRVYQVEVDMPKDVGILGWGPATFQVKFPAYNNASKDPVPMFWNYAHEDYLQTFVEWGYWGTLVWSLLAGIGSIRLFFSMQAQWRAGLLTDPIFSVAILLSLAGIFAHAFIDFPLQVVSLQLYVLLMLGFAWSSPEWDERRRAAVKRRRSNQAEEKDTAFRTRLLR